MKFEEKLMKLRKQKALSQEQLAEQLNVTRQTISKWELGQSRPDMDKLIEMSKLFDIGLEELTNDEINIKKEERVEAKVNKPKKKQRKFLLWIIILIFIAAIITLAFRITLEREKNKEEGKGLFSSFFDTFDNMSEQMNEDYNQRVEEINKEVEEKQKQFEEVRKKQEEESNKTRFNLSFSYASGTKATIHVETILDNIIRSNQNDSEHQIMFVYKGTETTDEQQIKNIKHGLKKWGKYEVSVDYDEDGYVNKITLEDI